MTKIIKNGRVIDTANSIDRVCDIVIKNGKIAHIGDVSDYLFNEITDFARNIVAKGECDKGEITSAFQNIVLDDGKAPEIINAAGRIVAPGLVDMHVHLRDPGQTHKEDIITGCRAAAAGGVTSLLCMPNTTPVIDDSETLLYVKEKAKQADAKVYIAAAATMGLKSEQPCDYEVLAKAGAIAVTDDGFPVRGEDFLLGAIKNNADLKILCHCEDMELSHGGKMRSGRIADSLNVKGIPAEAEWLDVQHVVTLLQKVGGSAHICHISTAESLDIIRKAKAEGIKITCETAPHYVAFTEDKLAGRDADYRMNPPLGNETDRQAIATALRDGTIDCIATDHAPHSPEEKTDFENAPNGVVGMETSLAAMMTFSGLDISDIIRLMSENPARILGIEAGTLSVGAAADIIIIDPDLRWTVDVNKLHGKSKNAVFKGCELRGKVITTLLDGKIVYEKNCS